MGGGVCEGGMVFPVHFPSLLFSLLASEAIVAWRAGGAALAHMGSLAAGGAPVVGGAWRPASSEAWRTTRRGIMVVEELGSTAAGEQGECGAGAQGERCE